MNYCGCCCNKKNIIQENDQDGNPINILDKDGNLKSSNSKNHTTSDRLKRKTQSIIAVSRLFKGAKMILKNSSDKIASGMKQVIRGIKNIGNRKKNHGESLSPEEIHFRNQRARQAMEDFSHLAKVTASDGVAIGQFTLQKTLADQAEFLKQQRLKREQKLAWQRAYEEARRKYAREYAVQTWDQVRETALQNIVPGIAAERERERLRKLREERIANLFERLVSRAIAYQEHTRICYFLFHSSIMKSTFYSHEKRVKAALVIQCAYRQLRSRRELLLHYILEERRLMHINREELLERWRIRLRRAYEYILPSESDAIRRIKRLVWAREEFSNAVGQEHLLKFNRVKAMIPKSIRVYKKEFDGRFAIKLPHVNASDIIVSMGRRDQARLNWIGVPVGLSESTNQKTHYELKYQPVPAEIIGVNLEDSRSRMSATTKLKELKQMAASHEKNLRDEYEKKQTNQPIVETYDDERSNLWNDSSLFDR